MSAAIERCAERIISSVVVHCVRLRWLVVALYLGMAAAAGWYTVKHVGISTDTTDMLAAHLPWRVAYADYKSAFPFFSDTLVVVIDAATPDLADESAAALAAALRGDRLHFDDVFDPEGMPFFVRHQFLYVDTDALEELIDVVSRSQAFLGRLAADPGLSGFVGLLRDLAEQEGALPAGAEPMLKSVSRTFAAFGADEDVPPLSWRRMLLGADETTKGRRVFTVLPRLDFSELLPAAAPISALRGHVAALGYDEDEVSVRLTGGAALGYDELDSVMSGAQQAGTLAFIMVAAALVIGLRSGALVVSTLVGLVTGLTLTACFATVAVGTLNMISVAFAVLYVGLGVDFAIHLGLRYRELCAGRHKRDALLQASRHVGVSLALCATTTAIGFLAFIPTDYRGVAELGLISGVGIVIGLVVSLTLLPALLEILPAPKPPRSGRAAQLLARRPTASHDRQGLLATAVLALGALLVLPRASFDQNPLHLNNPQAESVRTYQALDRESPVDTINTIEPDAQAAARLANATRALTSVAAVTTAGDLVPGEQDEKLFLIDTLALTLGESTRLQSATDVAAADSLAELRALVETLQARGDEHPVFETLAQSVESAAGFIASRPPENRSLALDGLENQLLRHFPEQLRRLNSGLNAGPVELDDLPTDLLRRWIAPDGRQRVEIKPAESLHENVNLVRFVDEVRLLTGPRATGTPVINIEASRAVTAAFFQAFATAAVLIGVLLFAILRRATEVLVVLAPLLLAGLLTTAGVVLIGMQFNFANIIALPLLMGIGVDSALHILHRYKTTGRDDTPLLASSTARGVLFSALTTAASFGNLAGSPHAGTASMGLMLSIGLAMTLICTLGVLPALLRRYVQPTGSLT